MIQKWVLNIWVEVHPYFLPKDPRCIFAILPIPPASLVFNKHWNIAKMGKDVIELITVCSKHTDTQTFSYFVML